MTEIYVGVDTNILLNFGPVKELKWSTLFPGVTVVNLLISPTVQKEMDVQKDTAKGYVQKRAKDFQRMLTAAEDTEDYVYRFLQDALTVSIHFLAPVRKAELNNEVFDLDIDDSRIVAEYFHHQQKHEIVVHVLANDARTVRDGKLSGMQTRRPRGWDENRTEPVSDRERALASENEDLKRRLGARPQLEFKRMETLSQHPDITAALFDCNAYLASLAKALKEVARPRTIDSLVEEFGLQRGYQGRNFTLISSSGFELTPDQLQAYREDVDRFFHRFDIPIIEFLDRLQRLDRSYILDFDVHNIGSALEEFVFVDLELDDAGVFIEPEDLREAIDWGLSLPEEPRPTLKLRDFIPDNKMPADPGAWTIAASDARFRRYSLPSLLHGHADGCRVYVLPLIAGKDVKVLMTLKAKNLLEPVVRQVVMRPVMDVANNDLLDDYLFQRRVFLPDDQGKLLVRVISRAKQIRASENA